ncbi:hypothetical protein [Olivibacter sp. XZL3]|uniref:hypothetical protein n=1 Tax=Olivibacter sp. XZL3 TaxID=1735116 RepID=UPI001066430E|nr:hypothetical protein [Olivibacter sp. XZL3]
MGKDKNGSFVPPKGRPSGSGRESSGLRNAFAITDLDEDNEIAEKYTDGPDKPAGITMRHQNRNVDKGRDREEE